MSLAPDLSFDLTPVRLSYTAALRGVKPLGPEDSFSYGQIGTFDPTDFLCLAASNPRGTFHGVIEDMLALAKAQNLAQERGVKNVTFYTQADQLPANLSYLCSLSDQSLPAETDALFALAQDRLAASGLLCLRYRAFNNPDESLRFLIEEYAPDLSDQEAQEFLSEIKALGTLYFKDHPIAASALEKALTAKDPSLFFTACLPTDGRATPSGTFEVMKGLLTRGFSFAGSADIASNYIQLAAPPAAYAVLDKCRDHLLYEPIKDFTLCRQVRTDIWAKQPVKQTTDSAELFGPFTFGVTLPRDRVPVSFATQEGQIGFTTPLFTRLIDVMCTLPMGIGDFLAHPAGQGMDPDEVVAALQVLVACGIAQPMRGRYEGKISADIQNPRWATPFNEFLTHSNISTNGVRLASSIVGGGITISARDALVLQAINRVGMANSAGVLQPELKKIIQSNPALAAQILEVADPSDEAIHNILVNTLTHGVPRWYAYGLLAA